MPACLYAQCCDSPGPPRAGLCVWSLSLAKQLLQPGRAVMLRQACESAIMSCAAEVAAATFLLICRSLQKSAGRLSMMSACLQIIARVSRQSQVNFAALSALCRHQLCSNTARGMSHAQQAHQLVCPGACRTCISCNAGISFSGDASKQASHAGHRILPSLPVISLSLPAWPCLPVML